MLIRIPKGFYDDHEDRCLPRPPVVKQTKAHYWIDSEHADTAELIQDAEFYADQWGPEYPPMKIAAKALLRAIANFHRNNS